MEIAKYLYNVVTESGSFIGQAFQAMGSDGTTKILTTAHQARVNEQEQFLLKPYIGKILKIGRNGFINWKNDETEFDVAEIPLRRYAGGIPVAQPDSPEMSLLMPSSRLYPKVAAQMNHLCAIQSQSTFTQDSYTIFYHAWIEDEQPDFGNSGAPILNEKLNVIAVATDKVRGLNHTYAGAGQLIAWKFNIP